MLTSNRSHEFALTIQYFYLILLLILYVIDVTTNLSKSCEAMQIRSQSMQSIINYTSVLRGE
jgi:hypothetical protein